MDRREIIGKNIRHYLNEAGMTQRELAKKINISPTRLNMWVTGKALPDIGMIQTIADALRIEITDITQMHDYYRNDPIVPDEGHSPVYHYDTEAAQIAQEIFDDKNLRALFQAARSSDADNIKMAATILERMKGTNPDG